MVMKNVLNAVAVRYALESMMNYELTGNAFMDFLYIFYPLTRFLQFEVKMKKSEAQMKTQGLSPSFVVASCTIDGRETVYSDFSGKKIRQTVLKDFPERKKDFKTWYPGNSKPYQHKDLYDRIIAIGKIGQRNINGVKHPLGYCAEQNVANRLLLDKDMLIDNIQFSDAIRPRTGEVIDYCNHCKTLFGSL